MKIFGHPWIESPSFVEINSINQIALTTATTVLLVDGIANSWDLIKYCKNNALPFAIRTSTIKESVFASQLGAKYILPLSDIAQKVQAIAQNYLFDAQILVEIENEELIEYWVLAGIDGVLFKSFILKI